MSASSDPAMRLAQHLLIATMTLLPVIAQAEDTAVSADPYLWLEDVAGDKALDWVRGRNTKSVKEIAGDKAFKQLDAQLLKILDSNERIPYVDSMGDYFYNFWRDAKNPAGIWRRTTLAEYRKAEPNWETVLDLDALNKAEKENWVWHGSDCLKPDYRLCLVSLSRGGADADVKREFDLDKKAFVEGGFYLPEAKSSAGWIDADTLYVGTDFGPGSMTDSGYPRVAKRWKRGTPLALAELVYEGRRDDIAATAYRDHSKGFERDFILRNITFYTNELFLLRDGKALRIDKPDSAEVSAFRDSMLINLREDWTAGGKTWPAGALLATDFEAFLAGKRDFDVLFQPTARKSLAGFSPTLNHVLLNELDNVRNRLYVLTRKDGKWTREPMAGLPEFGTVSATAIDDEASDDFFLTITDYVTPTSLYIGSVGKPQLEKLKQLPAYFNAKGLEVAQHEATSKDGTRIPYFLVARKGLKLNGKNPTLLYGYGGFEVSMVPGYSATVGKAWLEQGGVYVVANIRGGGEFGPSWHQAALKANRHHAYEDFIAVAEHLISTQVTSTPHLGIQGGSNGGLLMGNMLTLRPDLFGAIVCQVPLLDMRRYHTLLAGASWMGEYGNPDDAEEWKFIQTFSPYHNVKKSVKYPATLFTTSTRDDRVHPGHARKMMALLEAQGQDVRYYENIEGGHGGAANNKQSAFMAALAYRFLWQQLR
jgi:prolyl oligopeptidase